MRLEELEKEAKLYNREDECYIHVERCKDKPYACLIAGDERVLAQAIYQIICAFSEQYHVTFQSFLKFMQRAYKKFGPAKPTE